jgi:hypothetical protein
MKPDNFKGEGFLPKIRRSPEVDGQIDLSEKGGTLFWHNTMEQCSVGLQLRPTDPHEVESRGAQNVEATAPVHQDFSELGVANDRVDDKWVVPQVWDVTQVIVMVKRDGHFGPIEEIRGGRLRHVDLSTFALSLSRRELCRTTIEDHEAVLHLREPVILVVAPLGIWCLLLSVVLGLTASREVVAHHGALFLGVLCRAPMIRAWLF